MVEEVTLECPENLLKAPQEFERMRKESIGLEKAFNNGELGAAYEMLQISMAYREWYQGNKTDEGEWDYTPVPTWALEAAIFEIGIFLKHFQSSGKGRNARWLTKFFNNSRDYLIYETFKGIKDGHITRKQVDDIWDGTRFSDLSDEALQKAYQRGKRMKKCPYAYEGGGYQFLNMLAR